MSNNISDFVLSSIFRLVHLHYSNIIGSIPGLSVWSWIFLSSSSGSGVDDVKSRQS